MPDLVTHHYFGQTVFQTLDSSIQEKIDRMVYDFATAGPDPFFFVQFWKKSVNQPSYAFGGRMHNQNTKAFLEQMISLTKENPDMFSYLCGFLTHYYLDSTIHPYVFHFTGVYNVNDDLTHAYRGLHTKLERAIDCHIIENYYHQHPNRFKIHREILKLDRLPETLKPQMDALYHTVYQLENGFEKVNETIQDQKRFYRFVYDPIGLKNMLLHLLDNGKSAMDLRVLSYYNKRIAHLDIFNLEKNTWMNPVDDKRVSNATFFELVHQAEIACLEAIQSVYAHLFQGKEWNTTLENISYASGLECDLDRPMVYFKNLFAPSVRK